MPNFLTSTPVTPRTSTSTFFTDWGWQNVGKTVDGATALVLLRLAREADKGDMPVRASLKTLSRNGGAATSTVSRQIEILIELGLVSRRKRFDPDTGAALPTEYTLNTDVVLKRVDG